MMRCLIRQLCDLQFASAAMVEAEQQLTLVTLPSGIR